MIEPEDKWLDVRRFLANSKDLKDWSYARQAPYITQLMNKQAYEFFNNAFGYLLGSGLRGDYHEFGCYSARTFRIALSEAYRWELHDMKFFAYDSFCGLPEPESKPMQESWVAGSMAMSKDQFIDLLQDQGVNLDKVNIIQGFYDKSLTSDLTDEILSSNRKIALVNVDCDLRESAESVFNYIPPLLQDGSLIYLDDFFCGYGGKLDKGIAGAYWEFLEREGYKSELFHTVGFWGKSFVIYK